MFGSSKSSDESKNTPTTSGNTLNALAKGTSVEGTLRCESDLRIDGNLKGKLICKAKLIIGPTGSIDGDVQCQNAVIEGRFKGKLNVSELLNVRETAEVDGEISTNKLLVQSGARFNVACKMEIAGQNGTVKAPVDFKKTDEPESTKISGGKKEINN
jgi:cytoskeletal protein CcmA (bactofilin family)